MESGAHHVRSNLTSTVLDYIIFYSYTAASVFFFVRSVDEMGFTYVIGKANMREKIT
jgi:hypothetical protein